MGLLDGKVAVVSGLGPGLGRDIALALAREGAELAMGARGEEHMTDVAAEIEAMGRTAVCVPTDISDADQCAALAVRARDELGRIDILVNNAYSGGTFTTFEDSDMAGWRETFDVNVFGTLQLTRAALPFLKEHDDSRIVMISSMATQRIEPLYGAYAASKAALTTAAKTLALELGPFGVRVNVVVPGYIWGSSVEWYINHLAEERGTTFDVVHEEIAGETCLKYLPSAEEIAGAVVFFASPLAKAVTGQALSVNAGHWFGS